MLEEIVCPICGGPLVENRGKLVCPSTEHARYEETCCEGACGCSTGSLDGADYEEPNGTR